MKKTNNNSGFTIVELLLAMALFSFVLLMATFGFIQINRMFHRSNTVAQTQNLTRNAIGELSRAVKLAPEESQIEAQVADPDGSGELAGALCIGNSVFVYRMDWPSGQSGLEGLSRMERQDGLSCAGHTSSAAAATGLLDDEFTVRDISLSSVDSDNNSYRVSITISHGSDDLFEGDEGQGETTVCKGSSGPGSQFCAVSTLSTTIYRRLN